MRALSSEWANRLLNAIPDAYDRVVDAAMARNVDFVVVSGDIFDSARPSYGDYLRFFDGLNRLDEAGIPSYLCTGNHDRCASGSTTSSPCPRPPPCCRRPPRLRAGGARRPTACLIGGRGYPNKMWPTNESIAEGVTRDAAVRALAVQHPHAAEAPFAVGVLHTGLTLDPVKAP